MKFWFIFYHWIIFYYRWFIEVKVTNSNSKCSTQLITLQLWRRKFSQRIYCDNFFQSYCRNFWCYRSHSRISSEFGDDQNFSLHAFQIITLESWPESDLEQKKFGEPFFLHKICFKNAAFFEQLFWYKNRNKRNTYPNALIFTPCDSVNSKTCEIVSSRN